MFTNSEKKLLGGGYFTIIREEEKFIEVKSRNTGHCWMIFKKTYDQDKPVVLYHKHGKTDAWYHEHWKTKVTYKQGLEEVNTFYPIETYHSGTHTLTLFYPITSVEAASDNEFNVFMNIVGGGSVVIDAGNAKATISGQGLAAGLNVWDGKITIEETFEEPIIWEIGNYKVDNFYQNLNFVAKEPTTPAISQNITPVPFGQLVFTINELDESMDATPVVKSFSLDVIYPPQYDENYVEVVDSGFQLKSEFEVSESKEGTVNLGRTSVLSINTEQYESIDSMEVCKW